MFLALTTSDNTWSVPLKFQHFLSVILRGFHFTSLYEFPILSMPGIEYLSSYNVYTRNYCTFRYFCVCIN